MDKLYNANSVKSIWRSEAQPRDQSSAGKYFTVLTKIIHQQISTCRAVFYPPIRFLNNKTTTQTSTLFMNVYYLHYYKLFTLHFT